MDDSRIAAVEDNLLAFIGEMAGASRFRQLPADDVVAFSSDIPFPLFNGVVGARFAPGHEAGRTREVTATYLEHGLPFMWWTTPSTSTPGMTEVLESLGMEREDIPGMHASLDARTAEPPPEVELSVAGDQDVATLVAALVDGFGFPDQLTAPMTELFGAFAGSGLVNLLAHVDGELAGCGSAYVSGDSVGLYNIATLPELRGRGVGYAVTLGLMGLGRDRGAGQAVLHASEMGRPLYERLGFVEVCQVPQYVWMPPD